MDNYRKLAQAHLSRLFASPPADLAGRLGGVASGNGIALSAFGEHWEISETGARCISGASSSVVELLISLYAENAAEALMVKSPFISFKELPDSMPYVGAFHTHCQQALAPHLEALEVRLPEITAAFGGQVEESPESGDFAFQMMPLPKIGLRFICYRADDDFPASATCLYSNNAALFLPTDALADVGEYTVQGMIERLGNVATEEG